MNGHSKPCIINVEVRIQVNKNILYEKVGGI